MRTHGRPASAVPWHSPLESTALLSVALFTEVELPTAPDHSHDHVPLHGTHCTAYCLLRSLVEHSCINLKSLIFARISAPMSGSWASIPYQHNLCYAPLVPDNLNSNTVIYSSRVPTSASSCPVLRYHDPNFASDLSLLDICPVGATFLFTFFPLEVSETTIPFGLLRLAEQLVPCSAPVNALARLRLFEIQSPLHPSSRYAIPPTLYGLIFHQAPRFALSTVKFGCQRRAIAQTQPSQSLYATHSSSLACPRGAFTQMVGHSSECQTWMPAPLSDSFPYISMSVSPKRLRMLAVLHTAQLGPPRLYGKCFCMCLSRSNTTLLRA
ncbi:hypothetical protein GW17_00008279 [Ensete ventricosum]|nr:hypothetical protein GW17_00008279 [Ensete ventricosum]